MFLFKDNKNKYFTLRKNDNGHFEKVETNKKSLFRKHKFLLLLSSYKRPIYLLNQIHRMDNQNYNKSDFDISISSKGVSDEITKYIILPSIQNLIHEKQVFFRNDKNSNHYVK